MAYEKPITVKEAINSIQNQEYILPAIQREFVWNTKQIELLFDSILRDYPISTFLFWKVKAENVKRFKFYRFFSIITSMTKNIMNLLNLPAKRTICDIRWTTKVNVIVLRFEGKLCL